MKRWGREGEQMLLFFRTSTGLRRYSSKLHHLGSPHICLSRAVRRLGTDLCLIRSPLNHITQKEHVNRKEQLKNTKFTWRHLGPWSHHKHTGSSAEILNILAAYLILTSYSELLSGKLFGSFTSSLGQRVNEDRWFWMIRIYQRWLSLFNPGEIWIKYQQIILI